MNWRKKSILWLDYDEPIKAMDLSDVAEYSANAISGSVLVASLNVHPGSLGGPTERLDSLKNRVGDLKVPVGIADRDMATSTFPETCRRILNAEIASTLTARNGTLPEAQQINYLQLFNFRYKDGVPMLTIGGIFFAEQDRDILEGCHFETLDFVRYDKESSEFYNIRVPNLTFKELHHLDKQLPLTGRRQLHGKCIPEEDLKSYAGIYRHFTRFAETEF